MPISTSNEQVLSSQWLVRLVDTPIHSGAELGGVTLDQGVRWSPLMRLDITWIMGAPNSHLYR